MHRDYIKDGTEMRRGSSSKQFVAELQEQGVGRDDAIEAVRRMFGVPRGAAQLFVLSHPAWAKERAELTGPRWWRTEG
jgi:hypothetical protein